MMQAREFEEMGIEHISPKLVQLGYIVEKQPRGSLGDLVAKKGKEVWHINFKYIRDIHSYPTGLGMQSHNLLLRLGRLSTYPYQGSVTKYSILINFRAIGEQLIQKYKNSRLNVEMSIIIFTDNGYEEIFFEK